MERAGGGREGHFATTIRESHALNVYLDPEGVACQN